MGPAGETLKILGVITTNLTYNSTTVTSNVYVISNLQRTLLGRPVLEPLDILKRIHAVQNDDETLLAADASNLGLGAVNLQKIFGNQ